MSMENPAYIRVDTVTEDSLKVEFEDNRIWVSIGHDGCFSLSAEYLVANKDEARKLSDFIQNILQDKGE